MLVDPPVRWKGRVYRESPGMGEESAVRTSGVCRLMAHRDPHPRHSLRPTSATLPKPLSSDRRVTWDEITPEMRTSWTSCLAPAPKCRSLQPKKASLHIPPSDLLPLHLGTFDGREKGRRTGNKSKNQHFQGRFGNGGFQGLKGVQGQVLLLFSVPQAVPSSPSPGLSSAQRVVRPCDC